MGKRHALPFTLNSSTKTPVRVAEADPIRNIQSAEKVLPLPISNL